jgi:predicted enzyme related to lactoylglutathione lyase
MITAVHTLVYADDPEQARAFFRDVLGWPHVDAGGGWLIFRAPPTEIAVHPADGNKHELYLMCDDIEATMAELEAKGVEFTGPPSDEGWGLLTALRVPGGGELGIYQVKHPVAVDD